MYVAEALLAGGATLMRRYFLYVLCVCNEGPLCSRVVRHVQKLKKDCFEHSIWRKFLLVAWVNEVES